MNILCINTAFAEAQIVLEINGKFIAKTIEASSKTSEKVLPCVEELLTSQSLTPADLDVIGVVVGPGSFTGIRIGMAMVKGFMACFPQLKVVAINSLDLMAFEFVRGGNNYQFSAVQNALSNRFFVAKFDENGKNISGYNLENQLPSGVTVGLESEALSGVSQYISFNENALLQFVKQKIAAAEFVSAQELLPVYIRLSQAEENLIKNGEINAD